jgi:hypothetical protein
MNYLEGKENVTVKWLLVTKRKKTKWLLWKFTLMYVLYKLKVWLVFWRQCRIFKANSDRQVLLFDSDEGVKNSQQITSIFDLEYCNVPKQYLSEGINDYASYGKKRTFSIRTTI